MGSKNHVQYREGEQEEVEEGPPCSTQDSGKGEVRWAMEVLDNDNRHLKKLLAEAYTEIARLSKLVK